MDALLLSADLRVSSTVSGAAARCGVACETAMSCRAASDKAAALAPRLVVIDLGTPGLDIAAFVAALRALPEPPRRIVAFGPHVHEAKLAAARAAGCDDVLSRGRFHADVDSILASAVRD